MVVPEVADAERQLKKELFVSAYAESGNVVLASKEAGIHRSTHYDWLAEDPDYAARCLEAERTAVQALEAEMYRRAVKGVEEPVFYQGEVCGHVQKYSDTLLIFSLKGHAPEKYADRFKGELGGIGGGPLTVEFVRPQSGGDE